MANNFVSRGEVLTLTASAARTSGSPYRESGFNGVAVIDAAQNEAFTFQVRGIFEFALASVTAGDLIYIDLNNDLTKTELANDLFGRAVTSTDSDGNFHCLILQSE
jgi:predicted RecA/RadA family phage recombinase